MFNTYLIVWGIKVSGYWQYSSIEIVKGFSFEDAVSDRIFKGSEGVLQAFEVKANVDVIELRRIV